MSGFSGLSVEVSGRASDAVASLQAVKSQLSGTSRAANDAEDSLEEMGDEATQTTASMASLSATNAALSTVTSASLVPALGALSTTLVPLTATLGAATAAAGALTAGFGAVVGTGFLAYGEQVAEETEGVSTAMGGLSHELEPVREQLHETAMSLGEEFTPLIEDGIDAMPAFIRQIEDAIGPLDPFAEALRDAGEAAFDVVPRLVEEFMDLGRDALPAVRELGGEIADNAVPAFNAMVDTGSEVVEMLPDLSETAADVIPKVNDIGKTVLEEVIPALTKTGDLATDAADAFRGLSPAMQEIVTKASLAGPAVGAIATQLSRVRPLFGAVTSAAKLFGRGLIGGGSAARTLAAAVVSLTNPVTALAAGIGAASAAVVTFSDEINRLSGFLVGPDGEGGVLTTAVDRAANFLQNTAPQAIGDAAAAIGRGLRQGVMDLSNPLRGKDSEIWDLIADGKTWLVQNIPGLLVDVGQSIVKSIIQGVTGLVGGLVGSPDKPLRKQLADAGSWLVGNIGTVLADIGGAIVGFIVDGITGIGDSAASLYDELVGNSVLKDQIVNASQWLVNNIPDILADIGGALVDFIVGGLSGLTDTLASKISGAVDDAVDRVTDGGSEPYDPGDPDDTVNDDFDGPDMGPGAGFDPGVGDDSGGDKSKKGGGANGPGTGRPGVGGPGGGGRRGPTPVATGGAVEAAGLATLHRGERVLPESQVDDRGRASFDPASVAAGFDESSMAGELVDELRQLRQEVERTTTVRDRDIVRGLERLFDRHEASL